MDKVKAEGYAAELQQIASRLAAMRLGLEAEAHGDGGENCPLAGATFIDIGAAARNLRFAVKRLRGEPLNPHGLVCKAARA